MPDVQLQRTAPAETACDVLAVFATKGERQEGAAAATAQLGADAQALGAALGVDLAAELAAVRFEGDLGAVARIPTRGAATARLLLVVGLGKAADADLERLRRAAGAAARCATRDAALAVVVPADLLAGSPSAAQRAEAVVEGAGLGAYAFTTYRTKTADLPSLRGIMVLVGEGLDADEVERGVATGRLLVAGASLTRDLVNTPPKDKRPPALAERIAEVLADCGVTVRVLDEQELAEGGFGGILGVGQGSSAPPRLVEMTYDPEGATGHVVLVGKGITFDSGGLSLKPTTGMTTMKSDMAGAAAVVGTMSVLRELGVRVKVTGLAALAENMPSGTAQRVSDVLTHRGGTTSEVMNTDAEGRLVLADALAYATEQAPDAIIDLATLTGAQIVSLGMKISAVMGTDEELVAAIRAAGDAAGEAYWPLPLPAEYAEHLKSEVADIKNIGKPMQAGTIVAGLYLKEFTGDVPWAHLDIAGPAFTEEGDAFYTPRGATGVGVRTLARFLLARGA